eukprot:Nitzschia sp. Nitz4//scaffold34_size148208//37309//38013//NITZ4_002968-RA/size148208-processed-gene-0.9-mRNA-1//1//CDS//3329548759//2872//frame0
MGRRHESRERRFDFERIEEKMRKALTACFGGPIPNCSSVMSQVEEGCGPIMDRVSRNSNRSRSRQRDALRKMEDSVKKHVAESVVRQTDSGLTRDEDATLLTEIDMKRRGSSHTETDTSDSESESQWGSDTLTNTPEEESKNINPADSAVESAVESTIQDHIRPPTYKQTVRSKFDYYRQQHAFNGPGDSFVGVPPSPSVRSRLSVSERNMLAKQILQRRQNHPVTPSRSGYDP